MAIKKRSKSVLKNIRKAYRRHEANMAKKKRLKATIKKFKKVTTKKEALKLLPEIHSLIDKSVQDRIITKNAAGRYKSRLTKSIANLST